MTPDAINVIIEAQGAQTRQLVASLIQDKLQESGFTHVDTGIASRDDETSKVIERSALPSLLDEMRALNPRLFARPVSILAMPYSENPVEATEPHLSTMADHIDMTELSGDAPELQPGQGRLKDGTIIDLATFVAPKAVLLDEVLV
jgi:hypothetical protein